MPNSIKYNTSAETLSLKKGNFWIGTGDVGKGPTDLTGYYMGITPPTDGYTIYLNKVVNGPSIYTVTSDTELIYLTNQIANTSYTTVASCLEYYRTQSDKVCVNRDYETISTQGLIFDLDPGYIPSYPRTGNNALDVSTSAVSGTMYNSVGFNQSVSQGVLTFDGVDDNIDFGSSLNNTITGNTTFVIWFNPSSTLGQYAILWEDCLDIYSKNWRIQRNFLSDSLQFYDGVYINVGPTYTANTWQQLVVVARPGSTVTFYSNGVKYPTLGSCTSPLMRYTTGNSMLFGKNKGNYEYYTGSIGISQIYNRALSDAEVLQLYNAQVGRYTNEITPTPTQSLGASPVPTKTPTQTPTQTPTFTPTPTVTTGLTPTATETPTQTPTVTPTFDASPTPTQTVTQSRTPRVTRTPTRTPAPPTPTPTQTVTTGLTPTATESPTPTPTLTTTPTQTAIPTTIEIGVSDIDGQITDVTFNGTSLVYISDSNFPITNAGLGSYSFGIFEIPQGTGTLTIYYSVNTVQVDSIAETYDSNCNSNFKCLVSNETSTFVSNSFFVSNGGCTTYAYLYYNPGIGC